jgi:Methyltransferase domain
VLSDRRSVSQHSLSSSGPRVVQRLSRAQADVMPVTDSTTPYARRLRRTARMLLHPTRIRSKRRWRRRRVERAQLLSLLPKDGVCAEVGTYRGDFAAAILRASSPRQLYLIDSWEYRTEEKYEDASYGGHAQAGQEGMDAMYEGVVERFRSEIDNGRVIVERARSLDAAASFSDESLDWIYIDADHSYEGVKRDLDAYYRVVKSGGFIAGDDYGQGDKWFGHGVTRAVDEFAAKSAELTVIGTQFLLGKP